MKKTLSLLICSVVVFSAINLTACEKKDKLSLNNKEKEKQIALSKEKENVLDLNIYFDSSNNINTPEFLKKKELLKRMKYLVKLLLMNL